MAQTFAPFALPSGAQQFQDTNIGNTADVIKTSAGTLFVAEVDNTANVTPVYIKLYDTAGAVVVGTTVPDHVIKIQASKKQDISLAMGGMPFAAGIQACCVTTGGTAGNTAPGGAAIFTGAKS